jgi:hypothetical protein
MEKKKDERTERGLAAAREWNEIVKGLVKLVERWEKLKGLMAMTPSEALPVSAQVILASKVYQQSFDKGVEQVLALARLRGGLDTLLTVWEEEEDATRRSSDPAE